MYAQEIGYPAEFTLPLPFEDSCYKVKGCRNQTYTHTNNVN